MKTDEAAKNCRMLILDLDGTTLNDKKEITAKNLNAVKMLMKRGIKVIVCTGRIFQGARYYAKAIGAKDPVIACNGAVIKTMPENELLYFDPLEKENSKTVVDICRKNSIYIHAYVGETMVTEQLKYSSLIYFERNRDMDEEDRIDIKVVDNLKEYISKCGIPVSKLVIMSESSEQLKLVRKEVSGIAGIEIVSSSPENFEVMNEGVSKGKAIRFLCGYFGIPVEQTAAIGDNENDISLLETAGLKIAMGNAIPDLKQVADYITETNENNGVAKAVEWLIANSY